MTDTTQPTDTAPSGNELVKTLDTATRGHHPDSPSSLQASEACPLFENRQSDSQASLDGTLQHKAAETRDLSILEGNESMIAAVNACLELEDREIEALCVPFQTNGGSYKGLPTVVREKYLHVGRDKVVDSHGHEWVGVTGGFPDTLIVESTGTRATILDWKFGKEPVTPTASNLQGIAYALGAFEAYPTLTAVKVIFFAPHQQWDEAYQKANYEHTFRRPDCGKMELYIRTVIARKHEAKRAAAERGDWSLANPCEGLCVFCANPGRCTKNLKLVIKASKKYLPIQIPEHFGEIEISTPEHVAAYYAAANALDPVLKAIKKRCVELALQQDMVPKDWKICRRQDREVSSLDDVVEAAKRHGVKKSEVYGVLTIPISKVEKLVKDKAEKGMGAAAVRGFSEALEKSGAVTKGPAVHFLQQVKTPAERPAVDQQEKAPVLDI